MGHGKSWPLHSALLCNRGEIHNGKKSNASKSFLQSAGERVRARARPRPPRVCFPRPVTIDVEKVMVREIEKCGLKNLKSAASMHERGKDHESETKTNPNAK